MMDKEDQDRALSNKEKALRFLLSHRVATNHQLRDVAGSRSMARVWELQQAGHPISVTKRSGSTWEIRYELRPVPPVGEPDQPSLFV